MQRRPAVAAVAVLAAVVKAAVKNKRVTFLLIFPYNKMINL